MFIRTDVLLQLQSPFFVTLHIMFSFRHKAIALTLALTILVSGIGVAQVNHICKMALQGLEKVSCSIDSSQCCGKASEEPKESACCSNEIKVFRNDHTTYVQELQNDLPLEVAVMELFCSLLPLTDKNGFQLITDIPDSLVLNRDGPGMCVLFCSFLI